MHTISEETERDPESEEVYGFSFFVAFCEKITRLSLIPAASLIERCLLI